MNYYIDLLKPIAEKAETYSVFVYDSTEVLGDMGQQVPPSIVFDYIYRLHNK